MNGGYKSRTIEVIIIIEATKRAMDMRGEEQSDDVVENNTSARFCVQNCLKEKRENPKARRNERLAQTKNICN